MKKTVIITIIIIFIVLGFITGTYFYKIHYLNKTIAGSNTNMANQSINGIAIGTDNAIDIGALAAISANTSEVKISPECKLDFKTLYTVCGHTIETFETVSDDLVNLRADEFQAKYPDWQIQSFSSDEVDLYKETDDYCHQHYMLKDVEGYIGIYNLDENDNVTRIK